MSLRSGCGSSLRHRARRPECSTGPGFETFDDILQAGAQFGCLGVFIDQLKRFFQQLPGANERLTR